MPRDGIGLHVDVIAGAQFAQVRAQQMAGAPAQRIVDGLVDVLRRQPDLALRMLGSMSAPKQRARSRWNGGYLLASWTELASMAFMPLRVSSSPVTVAFFPAMPLRLL